MWTHTSQLLRLFLSFSLSFFGDILQNLLNVIHEGLQYHYYKFIIKLLLLTWFIQPLLRPLSIVCSDSDDQMATIYNLLKRDDSDDSVVIRPLNEKGEGKRKKQSIRRSK